MTAQKLFFILSYPWMSTMLLIVRRLSSILRHHAHMEKCFLRKLRLNSCCRNLERDFLLSQTTHLKIWTPQGFLDFAVAFEKFQYCAMSTRVPLCPIVPRAFLTKTIHLFFNIYSLHSHSWAFLWIMLFPHYQPTAYNTQLFIKIICLVAITKCPLHSLQNIRLPKVIYICIKTAFLVAPNSGLVIQSRDKPCTASLQHLLSFPTTRKSHTRHNSFKQKFQ